MSDAPPTLPETALDRLLELTLTVQDDMTSGLSALGLTESRTHLLWVIAAGGPQTQQALAATLGVSPRNVTGLVDGLVAGGFVTREPHPTDRRATLVTPTPHGAEVIAGLVAGRRTLADQLFGDHPAAELERLVGDLAALTARLRRLVEEASP
ncbi:MarR family winged helix-turn-helix transcriptional regulator [Nocardioides alkalitolerans]|uniref:MarR family winged helix-turn-helix transcriptional regulator n=1 Tax=Nocardioides alkalitolerans TaxID=281714 RepID=UPI00040E0F1E|nr:MarR family transcriptional regulator [Nocardioides alkalitolerans]